ncbi:MAG: hypothetical protein LCH39_09665 [Proteobacteria bacterium]|nr:hypothetical protein [Pseudomonadota bacterium]
MLKRLVLAALALACVSLSAQAGSMSWNIRAFDRHAVDVAFYSQNRKAEWPGNGRVWTLKDYKVHTLKLSCINGEKICYGAWVRGNDKRYWGVGHHNRNKCVKCCFTCGDNVVTPIMNLNE